MIIRNSFFSILLLISSIVFGNDNTNKDFIKFVNIQDNLIIKAYEQEVIEMDKQLNNLILSHNAKAAYFYYADDFILTTSSGKFKSKQDILYEIASSDVVMEINETSDVRIRNIEKTAILTGILHQKGIYKGNTFDVKLLVTDTWVKVDKKWKLLAGHATVIK